MIGWFDDLYLFLVEFFFFYVVSQSDRKNLNGVSVSTFVEK